MHRSALVLLFLVQLPFLLLETRPARGGEKALDRKLVEEIDRVFAAYDKTSTPGCALGVVRSGELVLERGYGMASLEHEQPIGSDTVFYIGSVSKQFTAAAILMAAREGALDLDDDIRTYLPEMPDYGEPVTVRQLVHHTSGIRDYLTLLALAGRPFEDVLRAEQVRELIARQKELNFEPGSEWLYSNSGYFLMSEIVQAATGSSLREYGQEKIFGPLAMRRTHFHDDRDEVVTRRAAAYSPGEDGEWVINWSLNFAQVGSGGLLTTVEDLLEWDRSFYTDELGAGFWADMQQPGSLDDGEQLDYAFGLSIDEHFETRRVHHGGGMFGYRAQLVRFPEHRTSVICLCNAADVDPTALAIRVAALVLGREEEEDAIGPESAQRRAVAERFAVEPEELGRYVGDYQLDPVTVLEISRQGRDLMAKAGSQAPARLVPMAPHRFRSERSGSELRFVVDDGEVAGLELETNGRRLEAPRLAPLETDEKILARYAGEYWSEELEARYLVSFEDGEVGERAAGLSVRVGQRQPVPFLVRSDGSVSSGAARADVERDASGVVTGFRLQAGRVRNLRFEKR